MRAIRGHCRWAVVLALALAGAGCFARTEQAPAVATAAVTGATFLESGGQVVIEAENATSMAAGTGVAAGATWTVRSVGDASGGVGLEATPNTGVNTGETTVGPRMDFAVSFATPGTYQVWVRMRGPTDVDNSVHVGLNGGPATLGGNGLVTDSTGWGWRNRVSVRRVTVSVATPGLATINVWMREDGVWIDKVLLTTSASFTPIGTGPAESPRQQPGPPPPGTFLESGGQVVIEAEDATGSAPGSGVAAGATWTVRSVAEASRGVALQATPNTGVNTGETTVGPRRDYAVQFATSGTYQVWLRMRGLTDADNSTHVGLNGAPATLGGTGLSTVGTSWSWLNRVGSRRVTVNVAAPGLGTVNVWMREDGVWIDKVLLTTSTSLTPTGTGPPESPRQVGPPDAGADGPPRDAAPDVGASDAHPDAGMGDVSTDRPMIVDSRADAPASSDTAADSRPNVDASADARVSGDAHADGPPLTGSGLFSAPAPWYQDIRNASLDPESGQVIAGLAARGGWGHGNIMQIDFGLVVLKADPSVPAYPFTKRSGDFFDPDCDFLPVPLPPGGRVEGEPNYSCDPDNDNDLDGGDCHLIVIQGTRLFEMWRASVAGGLPGGAFTGGCLAVWDLTRNYWDPASPAGTFGRGEQCSSADAGGYPIADLLFDADEVSAGEIKHAIRFVLPNDRIRKGAYVHPATHSGAGLGTPTPDTVPYGARFRLKASFDVNTLAVPAARVVARALQRYGMFLSDGGNIALTAKNDAYSRAKWSGLLGSRDLSALKVTDFEMISGGARVPLTLKCQRTPLTSERGVVPSVAPGVPRPPGIRPRREPPPSRGATRGRGRWGEKHEER